MKDLLRVKYAFGNKEKPVPFFTPERWQEITPHWKQVHGIQFAEVKHTSQACGPVDGMWTRQSEVPIAVVTADCIPLVLYRDDLKAIAVLHAGWRGVIQHIAQAFFQSLPPELSEPHEWHAVIGPSIRACCYEFGEEGIASFAKEFPEVSFRELSPAPQRLNIVAPLKSELEGLGLKMIEVKQVCTFCAKDETGQPLHFSYRRGDRLSRQLTLALLTDNEGSKN